ncbi:replication-relaxation family protein [Streptomyces sp. NPDC014894]|uniref:replication-relaxation family protein n=1 Tax=Streptomyces sp. NPDC014894 TaxID=3364931 RepID=UPI0036F58CD5
MAGKRKTNPAGSSNELRGDVLRVLGVLKVATADQIQRIERPHLSFRHTGKPTPSERKTARTAAHCGALSDLRKHGQSENGGRTKQAETLRNLTLKGLEAAAKALERPMTEMGGTARGTGSSGGTHAMAVNETIIAMLRPKPDLKLLTGEPAEAQAAARAVAGASPGIGTIASYATEIPLPANGTWSAPGKGGAQADIVLTAPQHGVPLLFIEVDNCHETAEELAAKLEKYARFFRRKAKDTDGREKPLWRTRWAVTDAGPDHPYPPVLIVFNHIGARDPNRTVVRLAELTRHLWKGEWDPDGYHCYDQKIPIVATGLRNLRQHGPAGPAFRRFGRPGQQTLLDAIGNPRLDAARARQRAQIKANQEEYQAQLREIRERHAEREARRPACTGCGAKLSDARWKAAQATDWDTPKDTRPHLCDTCSPQAAATEERTAEEQGHREHAAVADAQEADRHQRPEPLPDWAERRHFLRFTRRPVCTQCGAAFTDERWQAVERTGLDVLPQETRPHLCGNCDQWYKVDGEQSWPHMDPLPRQEERDQERDQEQAVPERKPTGWFSRLRR